VCDTVVNFEVVLASGTVVNANAESHADLFAALKGGSNNFGVVTRFDLATFEFKGMWGGMIISPDSTCEQAMRAFERFASAPEQDENAHVILSIGWKAGVQVAISTIHHTTGTSESPPSLLEFSSLQPQLYNTLRQDSMLNFATEQSASSTDGGRQLFFTTTIKNCIDSMLAIYQIWQDHLRILEDIDGLTFSLVWQPLSIPLLSKSASAGPNALRPSSEEPLILILVNPSWDLKVDDERVRSTCIRLIQSIDELAAKRKVDSTYRFLNYAYSDQDVMSGYQSESIEMMAQVSQAYDPTGFFQSGVTGGFKLHRM
jgi:hypothetical protein